MINDRYLKGIDGISILCFLTIVGFGILNIYSVDPSRGLKQLVWFGISFFLVAILAGLVSWRKNFFENNAILIYAIAILALAGVLVFGKEINGAKAWYSFGPLSLQPAEFAKIGTAMILGNMASSAYANFKKIQTQALLLGLVALPILLILIQPDFGTVIIYFAFILALYREGLPGFYVFIPLAAMVIFLFSILLSPVFFLLLIGLLGFLTTAVWFLKLDFKSHESLVIFKGFSLAVFILFINLLFISFLWPQAHEFVVYYSGLRDWQFINRPNNFRLILFLMVLVQGFFYFKVAFRKRDKKKYFGPRVGVNQLIINLILGFSVLTVMGFSLISPLAMDFLPSHQRERVMVLYEGEAKYRDTSGYNLLYSKTAIGSGELTGKGYLEGTVKTGKFVPEQETDYIFCTVGEEWGFLGSAGLLLVYTVFIMRLFYLAETQKSRFSRFFGYSTAGVIMLHFIINISMVMGLFPTVGIPLPYFSYGGSSFMGFSLFLGIFLILNYQDKQKLL